MSISYGSLTLDVPGHATLRIETGNGTVLWVDPWRDVLDGTPGDADVVFVTHDDFDHYDPEGIAAVSNDGTTVVAYEAVDAADLDRETVALAAEGEVTVGGVTARAIPAYNRPDGDHVREDGTPFHPADEGVGLLLSVDGTTVYVPSDTDFLSAHESIEAAVLVPPIGGTYTMDRHEAAAMARAIRPDLVVPVHYDTFEAIETDVEAFAAELAADGIRVEVP